MHVVNARAKKSKGKGINDDVSHEFNGSHLAGNLNSENKSSKGQKSNYEGYSSNAYNSNMNNQIQLFEDEMGSNFVQDFDMWDEAATIIQKIWRGHQTR